MLLIDNLLITSLLPILLFEYFKEKSWLTSLTISKVGLLIFQLSITEVSSPLDHSNMWSSARNGRFINFLCYIMSILSNKNVVWVWNSLRYKPDFVIKKNRNRPSQIHCLNSDGTGDLSLLRYKPDFVTSLFVINELYCIWLRLSLTCGGSVVFSVYSGFLLQ